MFHAETAEKACRVFGYHLYRMPYVRLIRPPRTSVVKRNHLMVLGKPTNDALDISQVICESANHEEWLALATYLVIDGYAIGL